MFESGAKVQRTHVIWFNDLKDSSILPWPFNLEALHFSEYDSKVTLVLWES